MAFKKPNISAIPSTKSFIPTAEQVYNKDLVAAGHNVKIVAGAGSGKSSSLRYIAASIPEKTFLVLCFNAANANESNAHPDKPDNIVYSTIHSIAYRKIVDYKMKRKLSFGLDWKDLESYALNDILDRNELDPKTYDLQSRAIHRTVLDTITMYCRTDKFDIVSFASAYLEYKFYFPVERENLMGDIELTPFQIRHLTSRVVDYWNDLIDVNRSAKISHDVYLKMYQLAKCHIDTVYDKSHKTYVVPDVICLDEAQDTNPVSEYIFKIQTQQLVLVGDPMQQLYEWRGAGKTMDKFTDFAIGYLTESFRFNSTIADMANVVLAKANSPMKVTGSSTKESIDTKAHLCRTNASVLEAMFQYLDKDIKIYTSIDLKDVFSKLYHMQSCYFNETPRYPCRELANIVDRASLEKALEYSEELGRLQNISKKLSSTGYTLTTLKNKLDSIIVKESSEADICITTIHASKGLEYDIVTIDDDFVIAKEDESLEDTLERMWETESLRCLLYVALSRGRVESVVPDYLRNEFRIEDKGE